MNTANSRHSDSPRDDLLDEVVAPSTVAMVILFGSIMFATVAMATRACLWGDRRALRAALSTSTVDPTSPNNCYPGRENDFAENNAYSYSVASRINIGKASTQIRPWEPTFISTLCLLYQTTIFGLILFTVYLIDNRPLHGAARSRSTHGSFSLDSEFDEDQFLLWIIMFLSYTFSVSWVRNGGPNQDRAPHPPPPQGQPIAAKSDRVVLRRRKVVPSCRRAVNAPAVSRSSVSGASSEGSDVSKHLEDVLLDDETSFNNILDAIDGDSNNINSKVVRWKDNWLSFLGLYSNEGGSGKFIQDAKPDEDILNRYQTLEWKGFLSVAMLIYHFNNNGIHQAYLRDENIHLGEDNLSGTRADVYENLIKVGMTSYLFLTGYSHTSFFFYQPNKSHGCQWVSRVLSVIIRINWSSVFLSMVIGKAEYKHCFVVTYCFLMVSMVMRLWQSVNYNKYLFRLKLFGLAVCIFFVWDCDISKVISSDAVQIPFQPVYEWYSLSQTHHWAAFCGIIFAINQPIMDLISRKLEQTHTVLTNILAKGLVFVALSAAVIVWASGPLQMPNVVYNISHPYFGIIPVLAFIYLRNICGVLRKHHVGILALLGKYSLEIYLFDHHAFTDNGCIILIPGYPRLNFLLVSFALVFLARALYHGSGILRLMLFPENDSAKCMKHASLVIVIVTVLYTLARALNWANMISVGTISTLTIICGILLYQSVLDMTWAEYHESGSNLARHHPSSSSDPGSFARVDVHESNAKISPPLLSIAFFLMAWCVWNFSGNSLRPCGATANDGHWVPSNPCIAMGKLHREFHATNYIVPTECAGSNGNLQWAWLENSQHSHCNYRYRNVMEVQQRLAGKKIVMIGDSSVRSLFQSLCRFMGDHDAGGYEGTSPSHSDATRSYGSTSLEYKWAPLSADIVTKLKAIIERSGVVDSLKRQPDLIISGGGAWDKMHLSVTDEDAQSQRETVSKLAGSLSDTGVPVIWFVPPTINTRALNSDEKRSQMSEDSIEEMRRMYEELGVLSSVQFVLDGPSFTRERAAESFDGLHYPPSVYDAGTQIWLNALDWLMDTSDMADIGSYLPKPGSMANPYFGLMIICIALIGLFFFDGYFGFSYLTQVFLLNDTVSPGELYDSAFMPILKRLKISIENKDKVRDRTSYGRDDENESIGRSSLPLSRRR